MENELELPYSYSFLSVTSLSQLHNLDFEFGDFEFGDFEEPYVLRVEPGAVEGRPHGVYSCFLPAKRAQLTMNGMVAKGRPFPEMRGDRQSSTACLAWSETWVTPY